MAKIATFDDWVDLFRQWQKELDLDPSRFQEHPFEIRFQEVPHKEIMFGAYRGRPLWERVTQIPDQRIQDGLLHLITYQGDTEFASVEQQRNLLHNPPSEADFHNLVRVMRDETRHGWQMSYLLVTYFGTAGKIEAQKLLERRADHNTRLLGSFNQPVRHWIDFFCYTQFIDRDGKYQLQMLAHSGFAPLARSTSYMLKEEFWHLLTGHTGLTRVLKAGKVPTSILQKYINKWYSTALDLFGQDRSTSAYWFYLWGLKGRYDEDKAPQPADAEHLNEYARALYHKECQGLIDNLNQLIPEDQPKLYLPDIKFNRSIGIYARQPYSVDGQLLSQEQWTRHLEEVLPGPKDEETLKAIFKEKDWLAPLSTTQQ